MNTPHPRCVIKPPKTDIYSEAPQLSLGEHPTSKPGQHNDRWMVTYLRAL